jgi:hypothetical protein
LIPRLEDYEMRTLRCVTALILSSFPVPALAGGLIQKLPRDGAWVQYYMDHRFDGGRRFKTTGHWVIRSVGAEDIDGKKCRWIEFERAFGKSDTGQAPVTEWMKYLVPEKSLDGRHNPLGHLVRTWRRFNQLRPMKSVGPKGPTFRMTLLAGAEKGSKSVSLQVARVKKSRTFPYQNGEFKVDSATREAYEFTEKFEGIPIVFHSRVTFTLWKHNAVPFGVAGATIEFKRHDAKGTTLLMKETFDLSVSGFGKNAKSALPEQK